MANQQIKPLGNESNLATGIGNSTTVGSATVVRVVNASGGAVVVGLQTAGFVGFSTFTMLNNTTEIVVKRADDLIHVTGGTVQVTKVGFTN
jgi:hypothetical protein